MDTGLAYTPVSQVSGLGHRAQYLVHSLHRMAAHQFSSECCLDLSLGMAIECFMGRMGKLFRLPWQWLGVILSLPLHSVGSQHVYGAPQRAIHGLPPIPVPHSGRGGGVWAWPGGGGSPDLNIYGSK